MNLFEQFSYNTSPGPEYEDDAALPLTVTEPLVKAIAFYLPQFHRIPQNDKWWGNGFTEWTNVTKALPRFAGHYQPRLPQDLGFYDLMNPETMRAQAELARKYGIYGFCMHYYWFFGQRLLEKPLELLLANPGIDVRFCVNWANESWTRRWDGHEKDILMQQKHSSEDDIAFAKSLEPLFRDPRYIRICGRPLLMIYRPGFLPDAEATVRRWRAHFTNAGLGNPYVIMAQIYENVDPAKYGMDAVVGFPPFWASGELPRLMEDLTFFDPSFRGDVVDYEAMAAATVASYPKDIKFYPGVCPSWDNEARRPNRGSCFTGSTPEKYGRWLAAACDFALRSLQSDERLVFINAWNEWAEGAYLEPDRHFGHAYLAETARALNKLEVPSEQFQNSPTDHHMTRFASNTSHRRAPVKAKLRKLARKSVRKLAVLADDLAWMLRRL